LNHTERAGAAIRDADVILALEPMDLYATLNTMLDIIGHPISSRVSGGVKVIALGTTDVAPKPNFTVYGRYSPADLTITGDAEATLPSLIRAVEKEITQQRKSAIAARTQKLGDMITGFVKAIHAQAVLGWDASPISTARLTAEVWRQIQNEGWTLAT